MFYRTSAFAHFFVAISVFSSSYGGHTPRKNTRLRRELHQTHKPLIHEHISENGFVKPLIIQYFSILSRNGSSAKSRALSILPPLRGGDDYGVVVLVDVATGVVGSGVETGAGVFFSASSISPLRKLIGE